MSNVPLPEPWSYCYVFETETSRHLSFSANKYNGMPPAEAVPIYTKNQLHAYAAAVSAADNAALLILRDDYKADLLKMQRERDALRERVMALERDAARYRWLRDPHNQDCHSVGKCAPDVETYEAIDWLYDDALDESIDAARASLKRED
jgi:hypothetical protein